MVNMWSSSCDDEDEKFACWIEVSSVVDSPDRCRSSSSSSDDEDDDVSQRMNASRPKNVSKNRNSLVENDDDVDLAVGVGWLLFGFGATAALLFDDEEESSKAAFKRSSVLFFKFNKSSWTLLGNLEKIRLFISLIFKLLKNDYLTYFTLKSHFLTA